MLSKSIKLGAHNPNVNGLCGGTGDNAAKKLSCSKNLLLKSSVIHRSTVQKCRFPHAKYNRGKHPYFCYYIYLPKKLEIEIEIGSQDKFIISQKHLISWS